MKISRDRVVEVIDKEIKSSYKHRGISLARVEALEELKDKILKLEDET